MKRKGDKRYVKWKGYDNSFNNQIDKKDVVEMIEYFPEPKSSGERVKVELNLYNYATKADLKSTTGANKSQIAKKRDSKLKTKCR